jgi:hypothetical protein
MSERVENPPCPKAAGDGKWAALHGVLTILFDIEWKYTTKGDNRPSNSHLECNKKYTLAELLV